MADAAWRTRNAGYLMFAATDLFVADKLRLVRQGGFAVSEAQATLFQNLDRDGTRLTMIAARAAMTKQSMIELVARAETLGLVTRRPDPSDGRARIVAFTDAGLLLLERLRRGVIQAERRMAADTGKPFLATLKRRLATYAAAAGDRSVPVGDLRMSERNAAWRRWNVGRVLGAASRAFVGETLGAIHDGGFARVAEVHLTLLRHLDLGGTRLTDLAARARMTKPAMAELVDKVAAIGLVARAADPADGRAKLVAFTPDGRRMLDRAQVGVARAERRMADVTGDAFVTEMKARLAAYAGTDSLTASVRSAANGSASAS